MSEPNTRESFTAYHWQGRWYLERPHLNASQHEISTDPQTLVDWLNGEGPPADSADPAATFVRMEPPA